MPELPEVQTVVDGLRELSLSLREITDVKSFWPKSVNNLSIRRLRGSLIGRRIRQTNRRGKYIVFTLDDGRRVLFHLKMSGRIKWCPATDAHERHEQIILEFQGGMSLRLHDPRKFGRFIVGPEAEIRLNRLGPEPLGMSFKAGDFRKILKSRRGMIKPLLLDQSAIAGLGNIYVDEALWLAGIHPQKISSLLNMKQSARLYRSIRFVLRQGLRNAGTSLGESLMNFSSISNERGRNQNHLKVYGRQQAPCLKCGQGIERIRVAQRGTHICGRCQKIHL